MFIVTVENGGQTFYLRGTTWAFTVERAQRYTTRDEAQAALDKAKKFMKASLYKLAKIWQVQGV